MMNDEAGQKARPVTVFGGSGFIGRHVVRALVGAGWRIRIGCRRPDLATDLHSVGPSGLIQLAHVDFRHPQTIAAALAGGDAAVNLVGILTESGQQTFAAIMSQGARNVAEVVAKAGITRFVHVSAIGADKNSHSAYARSKAEGEPAVREHVPQAINRVRLGRRFFQSFRGNDQVDASSPAGLSKHTVPTGLCG